MSSFGINKTRAVASYPMDMIPVNTIVIYAQSDRL